MPIGDEKLPFCQEPGETANSALIRCGFIGSSAVLPRIAFAIDTLRIYHCLRARHSIPVEKWVRVLCDLSNVSPAPAVGPLFSDFLQDRICKDSSRSVFAGLRCVSANLGSSREGEEQVSGTRRTGLEAEAFMPMLSIQGTVFLLFLETFLTLLPFF